MRIWIMANDREEKTTTLSEHFKAKPEVKAFCYEQKSFHNRNGVKVKIKKFKPGE
jgi:hypothetical protein